MLLIISQSAQMYFTPAVYITYNQNLSILLYCLSIIVNEYLIKLNPIALRKAKVMINNPIALRKAKVTINNPIAFRKAKVTINNPIALRKAKLVYNFGLSECSRVINSAFQKFSIYIWVNFSLLES